MAAVQHDSRPVYGRTDFERELLSFRPNLFLFARSLGNSKDDAEDLVQEACAKALNAWESYQPGTNMAGWVFMILRNEYYATHRKMWRSVPYEQNYAENSIDKNAISRLDQLEHEEELGRVLYLLLDLPDDMRDAIIAIRYLDWSYEEASVRLGCALGTMKSRVFRGTEQLKFWLTDPYRLLSIRGLVRSLRKVSSRDSYFPVYVAHLQICNVVMRRFKRHVPVKKKATTQK